MPHDSKGNLLAEGDEIVIRAKVKSIQQSEDYCNATVEAAPMPPYTEPFTITCNTKQLEKV